MELFLVRHAIAEARAAGRPDEDRALTPKGRQRFEAEVRGLLALGVAFDRLLHSPWRRAAQTAALLAPCCEVAPEPCEALARAPDPELLRALEGERVALVGHEPWLSELAAWLCLGRADGSWLELKKGGVIWLGGPPEPGQMVLRALHPPRSLRR